MKKAMVAICLLLCAVIVIQAASADSRPDGFWRFKTVTSENGASIIWVDWIPALCREAAKDNGNFRIGIKFVNQVGWITTNSDKAQYKLSTASNQDLFSTMLSALGKEEVDYFAVPYYKYTGVRVFRLGSAEEIPISISVPFFIWPAFFAVRRRMLPLADRPLMR